MVKGITQNVIPYSDGWAVYEDWRPSTLRFFNDQEQAMHYAWERAKSSETPVLIHPDLSGVPEKFTLLLMSRSVIPTGNGY